MTPLPRFRILPMLLLPNPHHITQQRILKTGVGHLVPRYVSEGEGRGGEGAGIYLT